jgi:hypothetical protein
MIKFYFNLIFKNFSKFIFMMLLFAIIQICYAVYEEKKENHVNDLYGNYDKLITYDVKFYEYLRAINVKLERQEEFNYINDINGTFYEFVLNLQEEFFKNIKKESRDEIKVFPGNEPYEFRISILNKDQNIKEKKLNKDDIEKIEKQINNIFFLTYNEFAFESIFNLVPLPRVKFFNLKMRYENKKHYLDKIFYQVLISAALSFCLIILMTQFKKKNHKLKKKNP